MQQVITLRIESEKRPEHPELLGDSLPTQVAGPIARIDGELDSPREQSVEQHAGLSMCAAHGTSTPFVSIPSAGNTPGERLRGRQSAVGQSRQNVAEDTNTSQQAEWLTVAELAAHLKCSPSFIYRRLNPSHAQHIPHIRLTPTDIRFDNRVIADLLPEPEGVNVFQGPSVHPGGMMGCTRHRDRKGSLLIRGKKRKLWLSQWPEGNKRLSHKFGWWDEMTRSQADRAHRQWMEKINREHEARLSPRNTSEEGNTQTIEGFFCKHYWDKETQQYRDELLTKKPSTRRDMKNCMPQILIPKYGHRVMSSLQTGEIQTFLVAQMQTEPGGISRKTVMKIKAYLSSIFSAAIRLSETGITRNSVLGVRLPSPGLEFTPAHLTADQVVRILQQLKDPSHRIAWQLAIWSGARLGKLRGLRWGSVAWEQNALLIQEAVWEGKSVPPKSRKGRRKIVLTAAHMRALREYKDKYYPGATDQDWVLPGRKGRPLDLEAVMTKVIKPIAKRLNISRVHWHALRHLSNLLLLNAGVDMAVRQDRLGHTTSEVNLIYSHLNDQSQLSAAELIDKQLAAAEARLTVTPTCDAALGERKVTAVGV